MTPPLENVKVATQIMNDRVECADWNWAMRPQFVASLLRWFRSNRRDFPWRQRRDPYAVWISETMLQQTKAATVVPYFERWMYRFPTVRHLARASEARVLRHWSGLGYYRRARNLHRAARLVVRELGGVLPRSEAELRALPGIGRYTAGAIRSLAFNDPVPVVDGNVARVLSRLFVIEGDIRKAAVSSAIWSLAESLVPPKNPGQFNEAMMELGTTVCTPRAPRCEECCAAKFCAARASGRQHELPHRRRAATTVVDECACLIRCGDRWLLLQRADDEVCARLWEFPRAASVNGMSPHATVRHWVRRTLGPWPRRLVELPPIVHHVMNRKVQVTPVVCEVTSEVAPFAKPANARWVKLSRARQLPHSSPQARLLRELARMPGI